ncbi:hypothetical protein MAPG_02036 [Magnaporthiopsis poae ATCC 64411]|uniref:DNA/RNA-binding domain-containing protein n=1 Tax=Magnaporthiopsis poae (strain ATCC 64411 / 73-15) TaxID=644358 RepID=A0A0C4DQ98_MAGP6|nr:hypothetical protein MAPG_02036 [Magnaporthiopsis poae ATCC 64411]
MEKAGALDLNDRQPREAAGSPVKRSSPEPPDCPPGDQHEPKQRRTPDRTSPSKQLATPGSRPRPKGNRSEAQDFVAAPREKKKLWDEGTPPIARLPAAAPASRGGHHNNNPRGMATGPAGRRGMGPSRPTGGGEPPGDMVNELEKEPETRPISQEQLIAEVKGIYSGLVMVESRCIEVDTAQTQDNQDPSKLKDDQWQALITLHRALLHEHHGTHARPPAAILLVSAGLSQSHLIDFFLASQHPSAGPALRRLASKYAMPARMWRHGIHSFLELLRHRLPGSSEYMLSFIYLAYSMMALLYETVPAFEDTWIECLGDLSRYRMAIEDDDLHDRNVWTAVSRSWYSKASDKAPTTGRLHHHLAILARPDVVAQLFYYLKSLTVAVPFNSARDSILTLFEPVMSGAQSKLLPLNRAFIQVHGVFFTDKNEHILEGARKEFLDNLDLTIARSTRKWLEPGYQIALSNIAAILGHGNAHNFLMKTIVASRPEDAAADTNMEGATDEEIEWPLRVQRALKFAHDTDLIVMARLGDPNILSYLHARLFFVYAMSKLDAAMGRLEGAFPWHLLTLALNSFIPGLEHPKTYESGEFPTTPAKPLPEDWALRGLIWTEHEFPAEHFKMDKMEDDERMFETPSLGDHRRERILWLACRIADKGKWIRYDQSTHQSAMATSPAPVTIVQQADPASQENN